MTGVEINGRNYWIELEPAKDAHYELTIGIEAYKWNWDIDWEPILEHSIEDNRKKFQEWLDNRVCYVLHSDWVRIAFSQHFMDPCQILQHYRDTGQMMIDATYINGIRGLEF